MECSLGMKACPYIPVLTQIATPSLSPSAIGARLACEALPHIQFAKNKLQVDQLPLQEVTANHFCC